MAKGGVKIQLQWDQDPRPVLEGFRKAMQNKIVKNALGPTSEKMVADLRRAAPKDSGAMKQSIGRRIKRTRKGPKVWVAIVGPRSKFTVPNNRTGGYRKPSKYTHLVERGHLWPKRRKGRARRVGQLFARFLGLGGRVKPHPFIGPLFTSKRDYYRRLLTGWLRYWTNDYLKRRRAPKK